jgi:hypothetical protein
MTSESATKITEDELATKDTEVTMGFTRNSFVDSVTFVAKPFS